MLRGDKELNVVGDRVLIRLDEPDDRTAVGLYLPPTALEKESVHSGEIVEVGPGFPLPPKPEEDDMPWNQGTGERMRYIPLQAQKGDHAIFLRKEAVEIKFDEEKYVVVPHSAILVLVHSTGLLGLEDETAL
jgi:co-chaperonin GroES (HSP10)